jgi:hypothetical protein
MHYDQLLLLLLLLLLRSLSSFFMVVCDCVFCGLPMDDV